MSRPGQIQFQSPSQKSGLQGPVPAWWAACQVKSNLIQPIQIQLCPANLDRVSRWCPGWGGEPGDRCSAATQPGPNSDSASCRARAISHL